MLNVDGWKNEESGRGSSFTLSREMNNELLVKS